MQLSSLKKGEIGRVTSVMDSVFKEKLLEMGCIPGVSIRLVLRAPLGDPLAFDLDGYCLSMRKKEADFIEVELIGS